MDFAPSQNGDITTAPPSLSTATFAGLLSAELLAPVARMQAVVDAFADTRNLSLEQAQDLQRAIHSTRALALRAQRLGRLLSQPASPTQQLLRVDELLLALLDEYAGTCEDMGVNVRSNIKPTNVVGEAGLLRELVCSVIEWAMESGEVVSFLAKPAGHPEHPVLAATVVQQPDAATPGERRAALNTLGWQHVNQVAHRLGAVVQREEGPQGHVLVVDFPPLPDESEVQQLDGADRKPWWSEE